MRRVDCRRFGVVAVEEVPWGDGKRTLTKAHMLFLARWAPQKTHGSIVFRHAVVAKVYNLTVSRRVFSRAVRMSLQNSRIKRKMLS